MLSLSAQISAFARYFLIFSVFWPNLVSAGHFRQMSPGPCASALTATGGAVSRAATKSFPAPSFSRAASGADYSLDQVFAAVLAAIDANETFPGSSATTSSSMTICLLTKPRPFRSGGRG